MKISYEWLQSFFNDQLPEVNEVARLLTAHAYEVEDVENTPLGHVLNIDVLPNRSSDSLSHLGVARELAVILDRDIVSPLRESEGPFSAIRTASVVDLSVPDDGKVSRASKRVLEGVTVKDSPAWLKDRLAIMGQRSINNIVDVTNYVTFEMGQPVHAFDFDKIAGGEKKNITIRYAIDGEKITLLDGVEYSLTNTMLVIADDEGPLDVAGIKGGMRASVDESTTKILLSVCNFDQTSIRRTADALKLNSEAAKRFKQGISTEKVSEGIERLTALSLEVAGGYTSEDILDVYPEKPALNVLETTTAQVNALLGTSLADSDVEGVLRRMSRAGFAYKKEGDVFVVTTPFERRDLINPGRGEYSGGNTADLIEEIGRLVGYDDVKEALPTQQTKAIPLKSYYYAEIIREVMISLGFSEVSTYSFVDEGSSKKHVRVENPLAENKQYLRHRISHVLNQKLGENLRNIDLLGLDCISLFEIGSVFTQEGEWLSFAFGVSGKKGSKSLVSKSEVCNALADALGVKADSFDFVEDGLVFECDFTNLLAVLPEPVSYESLPQLPASRTQFESISSYPFVLRDIAVWLPEDVLCDELERIFYEKGGDLLVRVTQFDSFNKEGRTSYAYRLVFQAKDRTLTDEEVSVITDSIYQEASSRTGWEIR